MPRTPRSFQPLLTALQNLARKVISSQLGGHVANTPPISWSLRNVTRIAARQQFQGNVEQRYLVERTTRDDLQSTLDGIVYDVVEALGYAVAMVATCEQGDTLPIRAFYIDPDVVTLEQVRAWEAQVSAFTASPVSLTNPEVARTYLYRDEYRDNLSVRVSRAGHPLVSDDLYSLFTPIAPPASRPVIKGIQQALGIQQVIAVPFFLETTADDQAAKEMVGNLFALKRGVITEKDILVLSAFGRQAAAAILSERRRLQIQIAQELVFKIQASLQDEAQLLQHIVEGVVTDLGYMVSMVSTFEADGSLLLRAVYIDPQAATPAQIRQWEAQVSQYTQRPVSLTNSEVARTYVERDAYRDNLGVRAAKARKPMVSDDLYSLFTPIAPPASRPVIRGIQQALGIQQVIAVPFFLEATADGRRSEQLVGSLFAITRSRKFSNGEIELLQAFAQQAAVGVHNARLYRQAEDRRLTAQMFGKMAFSASASVHILKNHIGAVRLSLQLINMAIKNPGSFPEDKRQELLGKVERGGDIFRHLDEAAHVLDNLHEPWRQSSDVLTDVNACLRKALNKIVPDHIDWVGLALAADLPEIRTTPDMLTEAFKVLIKNAVEAIDEKGQERRLRIESCLGDDNAIWISIRDSGIGIPREHLSKVFDMRWSTKHNGLGFGLFWTRDYIEGLEGSIEVESRWREGTTFRIALPVLANHDCQHNA